MGVLRFLTSRLGRWAIVFGIVTAVLTYVAWHDMRADDAFTARGQVATARLTAIEDRGKQNDAYIVEFATADGRPVRTSLWNLPKDPRPGVGDTIDVTYDAGNPELAKDARQGPFVLHRFTFGLAAATLLAAVILTVWAIARLRRAGRKPPSPSTGLGPPSPSTGPGPPSPSTGPGPPSPSTGPGPPSPSTGPGPPSPITNLKPPWSATG